MSLTKIQEDLKSISTAKELEIKQFNVRKKEIECQITDAENEKQRGNKIYTNITELLGGESIAK